MHPQVGKGQQRLSINPFPHTENLPQITLNMFSQRYEQISINEGTITEIVLSDFFLSQSVFQSRLLQMRQHSSIGGKRLNTMIPDSLSCLLDVIFNESSAWKKSEFENLVNIWKMLLEKAKKASFDYFIPRAF